MTQIKKGQKAKAPKKISKVEMNDLEKWFNSPSRNKKLFLEFFDYCVYHPNERFWQALRNWAEMAYVLAGKKNRDEAEDTFYWENKNK
jgi:hypothetical protein